MPIERTMNSSATSPFASLVRILLLTIVFGGVAGLVIWQGLISREQELLQEIGRLEQEMAAEVAVRDGMIDRLGRTARLARINVLEQPEGPDGTILSTRIRFVELDETGAELARREYEVPGDVVHVDAWTVRFEYEQVASGDPFAGQSLVLFRRIYSDRLPPIEGFEIDTPGGTPDGYAVSDNARFERAMWSRFWRLATDPEEAARSGVRVAQGEVVYKPMRSGQVYDLVAESSGGLTLVPIDVTAMEAQVATAGSDD